MMSTRHSEEADLLFSVTTADAQDILILSAAGLAFVKSMMAAVGTYSYFHIIFALVELACTSLAFTIYLTNGLQLGGYRHDLRDNSDLLYFLSFISGIVIEWLDVIFTYQTVRAYKRLKLRMSPGVNKLMKKRATVAYIIMFVYGTVSVAVVPLIAFGKADWNFAYFAPTGFDDDNSQLLFISTCIVLSCQGIQAIVATLNFTNPEGLINVAEKINLIFQVAIIASQVLVYIVLSRVSGLQAGALAYLVMINTIQALELACESARHMVWFQAEHHPQNDSKKAKSIEEAIFLVFQELDEEKTGYLPLSTIFTVLDELEGSYLRPDGAAKVVAMEQIDYRSVVKTISAAGLAQQRVPLVDDEETAQNTTRDTIEEVN